MRTGNKGRLIVLLDDGEAAIFFLSEEQAHSKCSCEMRFFFLFFLSFFFLVKRKVIEMSEKKPGSLEKPGLLECQRRKPAVS